MTFEEGVNFSLVLLFALVFLLVVVGFLLVSHSHSESPSWIASFLNALKRLLSPVA